MNKEDIVRLIRKSGKPSAGLDEALTKKVPDFSRTFNVGGRNRTRTCDPIDVNDVLSAPATFVQEEDEFPVRLQSRSYKGFHGICTRVQLHPPDRVRFFICTRVHDLCTLFAPGCRILYSPDLGSTRSVIFRAAAAHRNNWP